jgi:formylglycine-generating enzyme required for sulfatase activity
MTGAGAAPTIRWWGVCWYEADAFCQWLTQIRNDGFVYCLPTEKQWEATAAGFEKRTYPWGDDFDANRCNVRETRIEQISAVGIFNDGETPEHVSELAGNVWEWTTTNYNTKRKLMDFKFDAKAQQLYEKYISSVGDERRKFLNEYVALYRDKKRQTPTIRGGAWFLNNDFARCDSRDGDGPNIRSNYIGFRCSRTK